MFDLGDSVISTIEGWPKPHCSKMPGKVVNRLKHDTYVVNWPQFPYNPQIMHFGELRKVSADFKLPHSTPLASEPPA